MRKIYLPLWLLFFAIPTLGQQPNPQYDFLNPAKPQTTQDLKLAQNPLETSPIYPSIPVGTPDRFNEGLFTAKEQVHDIQIADLVMRVTGLEGTSNWVKGAIWALGILTLASVGFIRAFWRGIVKVVVAEAGPQVPKPS